MWEEEEKPTTHAKKRKKTQVARVKTKQRTPEGQNTQEYKHSSPILHLDPNGYKTQLPRVVASMLQEYASVLARRGAASPVVFAQATTLPHYSRACVKLASAEHEKVET